MSRGRWEEPPVYTHIGVIEGVLQMESPLSIRGNDESLVGDAPVLEDADGRPFIAGTTLAGVLRAEVEDRLRRAGLDGESWRLAVQSLFGAEFGQEDGKPSSLIFDDLFLEGDRRVERRDHVRLAAGRGVAARGAKYDRDSVAAGSRFPLRLEWRASRAHAETTSEERKILLLVLALLEGRDGKPLVAVGGRTRRGLGRVMAVAQPQGRWSWRSFDLLKGSELLQWVDKGEKRQPPGIGSHQVLARQLGIEEPLEVRPAGYLELELTLRLAGGLMVRSPGRTAQNFETKEADASHLRRTRADRTQEPILGATGLAGALRHRASAIAGLVRPGEAPALVDELFGSPPHSREPRAGLLDLEEMVIEGANEMRHTRVSIDPWTGGALDHFLFTEDVLYGGRVHARITVRDKAGRKKSKSSLEASLGLLFLALRDLWEGDLPVGGEVSAGRGVLLGSGGQIRFHDGTQKLEFKNGRLVSNHPRISEWVAALQGRQ